MTPPRALSLTDQEVPRGDVVGGATGERRDRTGKPDRDATDHTFDADRATTSPRFTVHPGRRTGLHAICLPGLVPDGPETFLRQLHLLRAFGGVSIATWPYDRFACDDVLAAVEERLHAVHAAGERPVLIGVSVGGGLVLELLRRRAGGGLPLAACILVSPLTCTRDLAPLMQRLLGPILAAEDADDRLAALERGRALFRNLACRSMPGVEAPVGWRAALALLTPTGLRAHRDRAVRHRIERTLATIPTQGALERVTSLRDLAGLGSGPALCAAPTLILWGSKERHTLRMDGPGTGVLCRPDLAVAHFPDVEVQWVYSHDGEEVPHASLLKHAHAFNPLLKRFLRRVVGQAAGAKKG